MSEKCNRFLTTDDSEELSVPKINKYLSSIIANFSDDEIEECSTLIEADKRELRYLIKGHFLTNGVINLIKNIVIHETGLKVTISIESLYSIMVNCIGHCEDECPDLSHLTHVSIDAFSSLVN